MIDVVPVQAFDDNYIWCLIEENRCTVVDPGDAKPVLAFLEQRKLNLTDILITHHHWDHTGGLDTLLRHFPKTRVCGPHNDNIPQITHPVHEGERCHPVGLNIDFTVFEVPGHTLDHIAFYSSDVGLFCGDTLFSAGCGRLFEGTPEQMYASLQKLMQLPDDTAVYCAHEYTLANLKFAAQVEPDNQARQDYTQWSQQQRQNNQPTLPSSIGKEKQVNPFLRPQVDNIVSRVAQHCGQKLDNEQQVFAQIRCWKDDF